MKVNAIGALLGLLSTTSVAAQLHTLVPTDDADLRELEPNTVSNYGNVEVYGSPTAPKVAILKFDTSSLVGGSTSVSVAYLEVYADTVQNGGGTYEAYQTTGAESWSETSVTWNNGPTRGAKITDVSITSPGAYYSIDVTSYVAAKIAASASSVTLWIDPGATLYAKVLFDSRRSDQPNKPRLTVTMVSSSPFPPPSPPPPSPPAPSPPFAPLPLSPPAWPPSLPPSSPASSPPSAPPLSLPSPPPPSPPPPSPPHPSPPHPSLPPSSQAIVVAETVQSVSSTITAAVGLSVAAAVVSSAVATSTAALGMATTAAAGGTAGATAGATAGTAGGTSSTAGGATAAGGAVLPLLLGAQRFQLSAGLGAPPSEVHKGVANSLGWMLGDVPFIQPSIGYTRRLSLAENSTAAHPAMPSELASLLNTLATCLLAAACSVAIYYLLVVYWRRRMNRSYYRERQEGNVQSGLAEDATGAQKAQKPAMFIPFPKSLMWPTPLFFTGCIFVTGLTRSSVELLAARPAACGAVCYVVPIAVLLLLVVLIGAIAQDLYWLNHRGVVRWKPAARVAAPVDVADPWMRLRAKAMVQVHSVRILASDTKAVKALGTLDGRSWVSKRRMSRIVPAASHHRVDSSSPSGMVEPPCSPAAAASASVAPPPPTASAQEEPCTGTPRKDEQSTRLSDTSPPGQWQRRMSLEEARASAIERLAARGHRDRKSGAYSDFPVDDVSEPGRTERILAQPWAFRSGRAGHAFQSREGFFMFRVNGRHSVGRYYRLIAIVLNMVFGVLSGLSPLLTDSGSPGAIAQAALTLSLQFLMAVLCCAFLPDADRIVSRFAATQFWLEGCSTTAMLVATSYIRAQGGGEMLDSGAVTLANNMTFSTDDRSAAELLAMHSASQQTGFLFSLVAMSVPMVQIIEQRCLTPAIVIFLSGPTNATAILAHLFLLLWSLPRRVCAFLGVATNDGGDEAAEVRPTADAGNDETDGAGADANADAEAAAEMARKTMHIMTLVGRALAAKEAISKKINLILAPFRKAQEDVATSKESDAKYEAGVGNVMAAVHFKHNMDSKKKAKDKEAQAAPSDEAVECDAE